MHTAIKKSSLIVASFMAGMAYLVACGPLHVREASAQERRGTPFVVVSSSEQFPGHPCDEDAQELVRGPALIRVISKDLSIARADDSHSRCGYKVVGLGNDLRWEPDNGLFLPEGYVVLSGSDFRGLVAGEKL